MRGTLCLPVTFAFSDGIIPAYAGNTATSAQAGGIGRDHPRVCGEHKNTPAAQSRRAGSSPRMRGTRTQLDCVGVFVGIIPAYAGNTTHPYAFGNGGQGSSPRMRGTRQSARRPRVTQGIIPAYAGNTWDLEVKDAVVRDHPRVCGEHAEYVARAAVEGGSSPRMRGTRGTQTKRIPISGIIPAYAGNTHEWPSYMSHGRDHPRVCGEHYISLRSDKIGAGSSPRMRGTPS